MTTYNFTDLPIDKKIQGYFRAYNIRNMGKITFLESVFEQEKIQLLINTIKVKEGVNLRKGNLFFCKGIIQKNKKETHTIVSVKELKIINNIEIGIDDPYYLTTNKDVLKKNSFLRLSNIENKKRLRLKRDLYLFIRNYLNKKGFLEVFTPILTKEYGGAEAKPFQTYSLDLKEQLTLNLCPELDLKRVLVSDERKIFSIHRCFRNESFDWSHHPEFDMIEIYQVGSSSKKMLNLFKKIVNLFMKKLNRKPFSFPDPTPFFKNKLKVDKEIDSYEEIISNNRDWLVSHGLPHKLSPLCKSKNNYLSDQIEVFYNNLEIANIYSEETSYDKLKASFISQEGDKYETKKKFLEEFKKGIPPTGGMGIGLDRILMVLEDNFKIEDYILFPLF